MSPTFYYLTIALLLVCSCCAIVKGADFGTLYSTQSTSTSFTFPSATPSCTAILSIKRASNQLIQFTLSKNQASAYTSRVPDSVHEILGVYSLSVRSYNNNNGNSTQFTLTFTCPNGILNVKPTNMGIFTIPSYYFVNTGASSNTDATSISYTMTESNGFVSTIGFLAIVETGGSTLGYYQTFYGPYQFGYNLATNSYGQVSESLSFKLPNVVPSYNPYSFTLSKASSSYKYQPSDYTTLYSFEMSKTSNPNTYGASVTYNYVYENSFTDVNGNSISIQQDTLQCVCSTNGYSYITVSSTTSTNSLSCTYISSSCQYLSIIAKSAVDNSPNPSIDTAIEMEDGAYVFSGTITKKTYYKIEVPAGETLYLKYISLHLSSDYSGYITLNSESTYNSQKIYVYSSTHNSQLSYTNYLSTSKTVYVTIEPYGSYLSTSIDFIPRLSSSISFGNFPIILVCSIIGPLFTLISIIVVITTIKKNSRRNEEQAKI